MQPAKRESLDIERLLEDLHRKKCWLDDVIDGLEKAIRSPEMRLIEAVHAAFDDEQAPRVDLAEDEEGLLRTLAAKVPRYRQTMETQSASDDSEEAA